LKPKKEEGKKKGLDWHLLPTSEDYFDGPSVYVAGNRKK